MKVKCKKILSETTKEDLGNSSPWLTIDKEYIVLMVIVKPNKGVEILIQSDSYHEPILISLDGFEVMDQKMPSNWVTGIKNNAYYMMPNSWLYDDFFDGLEDQTPKVMALFKTESEIIYREAGWIS
jgi:hypothetical protein